jgi:hypothetical protein
MPDQIRFKDLLEDQVFRAWFNRRPSDPPKSLFNPPKPAWYVMFQREQDGRWTRASFTSYAKAHKYVRTIYKDVWDLALGCYRRDYGPPLIQVTYTAKVNGKKVKKQRSELWRRSPEGHRWCGFCRRPTVFRYFTKHHALPLKVLVGYELRCSICGARLSFLRDWYRHREAS